MNGALTASAAFLLGLVASGHCLAMCGGITAALGVATARDAEGRLRPILLLGYQLGRITSYALAGSLFAGALGALIALLDIEAVRWILRIAAALAFLAGALVAFGRLRDIGTGMGRTLWSRLAPLGRRFLPVDTLPRSLAFGMIWGWMPCGFVYTVLLIATLQQSALHGATIMAAFGLGTIPSMLLTSFAARGAVRVVAGPAARRVAGAVLLACALLTVVGPGIHALPGVHALFHLMS
jgi:sulfite exporter TauE/SafE